MSGGGGRGAAVTIVGAGAWGTGLAQCLASAGRDVMLVARDPGLAERIRREHSNPAYLPGVLLSPAIRAGADLAEAVATATMIVIAVPTHGFADVAARAVVDLAPDAVVVSAAKGFELDSGATMTEVLERVMGASARRRVAALSGPNIAVEVARGLPAASVVAAHDEATAARVRDALSGPQLRCYSNLDVVGVEYAGALKNVVAIAAGICDGIGGGDNAKAAIITRGLAEMSRLGVAAGAHPMTFAGLAGLGDVAVTCMSPYSRNRRLGEAIGQGRSLADVEAGMFQVAEGVNAARGAHGLGRRMGVSTPIVDEVCAVLFEGKPVVGAIADLMRRETRDEADSAAGAVPPIR